MISEKRSIPCRLLICCLACILLFWSLAPPLEASASAVAAATASVVGISPPAAIAGILICLGVAFVASGSFGDLVDDIVASLPSKHFITYDSKSMIEGLKKDDTVYVSQELVEDVNDLLYESNTLPSSSPVFTVSYSLPEDYAKVSGLGFQSLYNYQGINWHDYDFNYCYLLS